MNRFIAASLPFAGDNFILGLVGVNDGKTAKHGCGNGAIGHASNK
jgi:hypothetical protein